MEKIEIKSLPVKHIIRDIAEAFDTDFESKCDEFTVHLPPEKGSGFITGIDTEGGVGVLLYDCTFKEETLIEFSLNAVHPLKFLYLLKGSLEHCFENDRDNVHKMEEYQTAIIASRLHHGHILTFKPKVHMRLHSLEINRKEFIQKINCDLQNLNGELNDLFEDVDAENHFYFKDHFSLELAEMFKKMYEFEDLKFMRKIFLEGLAYEILIKQIKLYLDSEEKEENLLRTSEVDRIKKAVTYIEANITETPGVQEIAREVGLNTNKLQHGFKILYDSTVNRYVHQTRLDMAKHLLLHTDYNISEVAERVGLNNKSYFSKVFKECYHISPSEFKEKNKRKGQKETSEGA